MTDKKKVFVLGAGFTKAFVPDAPLMVDDYTKEIDDLLKHYGEFPHAKRILEQAKDKRVDRKINIEELMTRLSGSMPYDFEQGADKEIELLLQDVKEKFLQRIENAKESLVHKDVLGSLARYCIQNKVHCITFNYDDVFDRALCEFRHPSMVNNLTNSEKREPFWYPDTGYGFYCRSSDSCIDDALQFPFESSMVLLKLHGSLNWRIKLGETKPYSLDSLVHDEKWLFEKLEKLSERPRFVGEHYKLIPKHLEPEPLIIPPVLNKSDLSEMPILKRVWTDAHKILTNAQEITFVGYSLPITDIAARFLFTEAIQPEAKISVVNRPEDDEAKEKLKADYKDVFPNITDSHFYFRNALDWAQETAPQGH